MGDATYTLFLHMIHELDHERERSEPLSRIVAISGTIPSRHS